MPAKSRKRSISRRHTAGRSAKDAIALLKKDHKNVKQLLKRLEGTSERNTNQREQFLTQIEHEVKTHTTIEEEIFYPAFKGALRAKSDAHLYFEALEEHHLVDVVMQEIRNTESDSEEFAAKAKVLKDLIEHHAEEEEAQMFPKARKAMGAVRLRELGQELQQRKRELSDMSEGNVDSINRRRRITAYYTVRSKIA
ncbi:MAG TPA: hemerythrin domain-containing protein [Terriglobia bacterium]|nr:hemerythrin domain-containing protein [Terriglobia bacterium]